MFPQEIAAYNEAADEYNEKVIAYIFDIKDANGIEIVRSDSKEMTIFDLSGSKLKNATAPGVYIINGEKKVVR